MSPTLRLRLSSRDAQHACGLLFKAVCSFSPFALAFALLAFVVLPCLPDLAAGEEEARGAEATVSTEAAQALYEEGRRLFEGETAGFPNHAGAAARMLEAAEAGHPEAMGFYGFLLSRGLGIAKDETAALSWLERAAEREVPSARLNLGLMHLKGLGTPRDAEAALRWIEAAAAQGHLGSQKRLAEIFYFGEEEIAKDEAKALPWVREAAEGGDPWAQNLLGTMFEWGIAVELDRAEAMEWYQRAAEQGEAKAQASYGRLLASGLVGPRDAVEAYVWLWRSAEQNEVTALNFLKDFVPGMTAEEREEALRRIGVE